MPPVRTVTDLLAEQSEETLREMQETVAAELARLTVEAQQIEQALAKKARRERASGRGGGMLSREQVFAVVEESGQPLTATEVAILLSRRGIDASSNAIRNHLNRLVDQNGWLARTEDGHFVVSPARADDDIPF